MAGQEQWEFTDNRVLPYGCSAVLYRRHQDGAGSSCSCRNCCGIHAPKIGVDDMMHLNYRGLPPGEYRQFHLCLGLHLDEFISAASAALIDIQSWKNYMGFR